MITRIGRRRTFAGLRRDGRRVRHGSVRLSFLPLDTPRPQVAFAIGRSFGNAVERNRGRRRLRAAFVEAYSRRSDQNQLLGAYLLTGTRGLLTERFAVLVEQVTICLDKIGDKAGDKVAADKAGDKAAGDGLAAAVRTGGATA